MKDRDNRNEDMESEQFDEAGAIVTLFVALAAIAAGVVLGAITFFLFSGM